jgi:uncharacterized protein YndB with AHSA1/START domain
MGKMAKAGQQQTTKQLTITRIFDAPRELVWKVWTEPEGIKRWWGPKGYTSPACKTDFRVGGSYHFCMQSPEGQQFWSTGVYREIRPLERIVYTDNFADEAGNVIPASEYGILGDWPAELLVTVIFEDQAGKTKITLTHEGLPEGEMREMSEAGWNESLDKIAEVLREKPGF